MKFKFSDIVNKDKIIVDVCLRQLSNQRPYLSFNVLQAKSNGVDLRYSQQDYYNLLLKLNSDFSWLYNYKDLHYVSNGVYHFKELLSDLFKQDTRTIEQLKEEKQRYINSSKEECKKLVGRRLIHESYYDGIEKYLTDKYSNIDHIESQLKRTGSFNFTGVGVFENFISELSGNKAAIQYLNDLIRKAKYQKDVWTVEKYSRHYGLYVSTINELILNKDRLAIIESILQEQENKNKIKLAKLVKQYNIPTVLG